jgi:HlyD family secretion protein
MKPKRKTVIIWSVVILLVLLLAWAMRPKPVEADFAAIERGSIQVTIDEEGETRVRDRFTVSAPMAGRVLRIELEPGDPVVGGETVVATFRPSDPVLQDARTRAQNEAHVGSSRAALGTAEAEVQRARAELEYALSEEKRYRRLFDDGFVSSEQLEKAELDARTRENALSAAEFAVRSAEQELAAARASLVEAPMAGDKRNIIIRAPVDGVVLQRFRWSEGVVPVGEPLVEIADPADLEIVSDLLSSDAVKVRHGQKVLIERWGGEKGLEGEVRRVEPYGFTKYSALGVEEQRVNVIVDFADPREAWAALGDGYRVELRIVTQEAGDVLLVPTSSLFRMGEEQAVFAVRNGRAALITVEIGKRNGLHGEVLSGLEEGDTVIVHPGDAVADGVKVAARS